MGKRAATRAERRLVGASQVQPPSMWRRISFWLGITMVLGGLGLMGWVGWQFYGTNWLSKQAQAEAVASLEEVWQSGKAREGLEPRAVELGQASALIRIPRFGDDYVMPVFEGIDDEVLAKGFGHFEETADPGKKGNYALAAHRVTHGEPLREMPSLEPGDAVLIETATHNYTYELTTDPNDLVVPFTEVWVLDDLPKNPFGEVEPGQEKKQRLITLTTCAELFHTDDRMIAFGKLTKSERKAVQS